MPKTERGPLVIIGGAEDKKGDRLILKRFVELAGGAKSHILVMTVASQHPAEMGKVYTDVFTDLGVGHIKILDIESRDEAGSKEAVQAVAQATGVFFTGGDQVRITTLLGGSPVIDCLFERYGQGIVIAGTSAGASAMSTAMIEKGEPRATASIEIVSKGPGLGLLADVIIDQHFSQRGRVSRLISAVAEHPGYIGIGIDEDTAIIVHKHEFEVLGAGAVTIVDATNITYTNADDHNDEHNLAVCGLLLHILPHGYRFDLHHKRPLIPSMLDGNDGNGS